jgi:hypothetical protein
MFGDRSIRGTQSFPRTRRRPARQNHHSNSETLHARQASLGDWPFDARNRPASENAPFCQGKVARTSGIYQPLSGQPPDSGLRVPPDDGSFRVTRDPPGMRNDTVSSGRSAADMNGRLPRQCRSDSHLGQPLRMSACTAAAVLPEACRPAAQTAGNIQSRAGLHRAPCSLHAISEPLARLSGSWPTSIRCRSAFRIQPPVAARR